MQSGVPYTETLALSPKHNRYLDEHHILKRNKLEAPNTEKVSKVKDDMLTSQGERQSLTFVMYLLCTPASLAYLCVKKNST